MKILIISAYFPPQNSIASLRPYSWAKYWVRDGHNVTVLTTVKRIESNGLSMDLTGIKIIELPFFKPFSSMNNKVNNNSNKKETIGIKVFKYLKDKYQDFSTRTGCFLSCRYPDWHDYWAKDAISYLNKNGLLTWDLVISTAWPYSVHRIGCFLKKRGNVLNWVVDWRDLWTQNHMYPGIKLLNSYERNLEKKFHKYANKITTVSIGLKNELQKITNTPISVIYNGFDIEDYSGIIDKPRKLNNKLTISYFGTIYKGFRDPEPLIQAISNLHNKGLISSQFLKLEFAGANSDIRELINKYGLENYYEYLGFLSRDIALKKEYDSDVLLFLEYDNRKIKGVLTGKIFEYIYLAKQIMAIGITIDSAVGDLIQRTKSGDCFGTNIERIQEYIYKLYQEKQNNEEPKFQKKLEEISDYDRAVQAQKIIELIK